LSASEGSWDRDSGEQAPLSIGPSPDPMADPEPTEKKPQIQRKKVLLLTLISLCLLVGISSWWLMHRDGLETHGTGDFAPLTKKYDLKQLPQTSEKERNIFQKYSDEGDRYLLAKQYDKAVAAYSQALQYDPRDAYSYHSRGFAFYKKGNYDLAIADLHRALEIEPQEAKSYHVLALSYGRKGQFEEAMANFNRALEIDRNALIYWNKAAVCEEAGRLREALEAYQAFTDVASGSPYAARLPLARDKIKAIENKIMNR
jgi:tetratricopeptide (TPR) repeat protein